MSGFPQIDGVEQQALAMYSVKQLSAGEVITYDLSPQIELLKSTKVFRLNIDNIGATMSFFMLQPCTCGAANCKRVLGSYVRTVGPRQCSACQTILLQASHELH